MNHKRINKMNPKGSNVFKNYTVSVYTTLMGSNFLPSFVFYRHVIPSGLETEIQNNLKGLRYE